MEVEVEVGDLLELGLVDRKMLHGIQPVKYLGATSHGKLSELENAPSCVPTRAK